MLRRGKGQIGKTMNMVADRKERLASLAGVGLLHLLLGWALLLGLTPGLVRDASESLEIFNLREPPPPPIERVEPETPPPVEQRQPRQQPQPAPAPARREPSSAPPARPPAASPRKIARDVSPPVAAGVVPSSGGQVSSLSGDPDWMGVGGGDEEGSGAGGAGRGDGGAGGNGTGGSGAGGTGSGSGGSGRATTSSKLRGGAITRRDYPRGANGAQGTVEANLTVSPTGTVTGCKIMRSSGNRVLDETTCRLIRERFRFDPARDAQGRAVADVKGWRQQWWRD